jgi:hypothetical protein
MSSVFQSTFANTLKRTLNMISRDTDEGSESSTVMRKWCNVTTMDDAYEDDLETAGPGLMTEKTEGAAVAAGSVREGVLTRYWSRTFAQKLVITEEAIEDIKYKEVVNMARMLKRAMWKTVDYDSTNILARGHNTSYVGGDGLPLWSASHTLPHGGTFSNTLATPMSPSVQALIVATTQILSFVGHDGLVTTIMPKKVVYPNAQWAVWRQILGSDMTPTPGNFAEINVAKKSEEIGDLEPVRNPFWLNTTTNWALFTDVEDGVQWKWRRRPRSRTWVDNNNETMNYSESARWARGWTNARCTVGSNA